MSHSHLPTPEIVASSVGHVKQAHGNIEGERVRTREGQGLLPGGLDATLHSLILCVSPSLRESIWFRPRAGPNQATSRFGSLLRG